MKYNISRASTPLGDFCVALTDNGAVAAIGFPRRSWSKAVGEIRQTLSSAASVSLVENGSLASRHAVCRQLNEYLRGTRRRFDLPYSLDGFGDFQRAVWRRTAAIPYGQTRSYGQIAQSIGKPGAARAVGGALGKNPLPLLVPCHRVVRTDGAIGGFSGGPGWKERLLALEQKN